MIKGNRVIEQTKQMILVNYSLDQLFFFLNCYTNV